MDGTTSWQIGRPTMRGVKKCPKCGTINGTRGFSCKNKNCRMVLRSPLDPKKSILAGDACKLYTGTDMQIYSVRLAKDKGPDYRGFVLLPMVEGMEGGSQQLEGEAALLVQSASRCYVDQCPRAIAQGKEFVEVKLGEGCSHIRSCLSTGISHSSPVILRHSAMNDLEIRSEFKHDVYSFAETISGPLVQRVNRQVFVVQCEADTKHPLGYLHLAFIEQKVKEKPASEQRFFCTCDTFRGLHRNSRYYTQWSPGLRSQEPDWMLRRCIHYYACLCAFASDKKLKEEFKHYLELDSMLLNCSKPNENQINHQPEIQMNVLDEMKGQSLEVLDLYGSATNVAPHTEQIEIRVETTEGMQSFTVPATNATLKRLNSATSVNTSLPLVASPATDVTGMKRKLEDQVEAEDAMVISRHLPSLPLPSCGMKHDIISSGSPQPCLGFQTWLASITERINQTMHYQFPGNPDPLVFTAPESFFECLRDRISLNGKKKRLPNNVVTFVRRDALPVGTFSKFTWNITTLTHVQQIFDTPQVPLLVEKVFVANKDGTYSPAPSNPETDSIDKFSKLPGKLKIKAHEMKTFLRVGSSNLEPGGKSTFDIEWIPDILPTVNMGELRIRFCYGHSWNGKILETSSKIR
eukprot:TRINITY_DN10998_c0_g1_i7.p1 TRINITY_DN10998_c0_g1~~TRINITY_DN10998_c0_g1_i7.p1  ORF type:complete len:634 (-),score=92.11 TRINITY_DN10998_c0_g1_i7:360-2261(-)